MAETPASRFFRALPLFQGLPGEQVELLAARAVRRTFRQGERILSEHEEAKGFFLLESGRAKLYKLLPDGKEQTIYLFSPGEPFCLCSAFDITRYPANAAALEDSSAWVISGQDFRQVARESPELVFNILLILSRRLKEAMELIESLAMKDLGQRLALLMLRLSEEGGEKDALSLPMTHRELAKVVGVTPEALSRTFRRLAESGLVRVEGQRITFLNRTQLRALAQGG